MGLFGSVGELVGADQGYKKQKSLTKWYINELNMYQGRFEDLSANYLTQFKELSNNFNPYDLQNEYDSLYGAVIQPMEQQFSETVLPQIRKSYSGGAYGSQLFSGGRESTEAKSRQELSLNEALLKYQAREQGIARNYQNYDRRQQSLGLQLQTETAPIQQGLQVASQIYGARQDQITADVARYGAMGGALDTVAATVAGFAVGGPVGGMIAAGLGAGMKKPSSEGTGSKVPAYTYVGNQIVPDYSNPKYMTPFRP